MKRKREIWNIPNGLTFLRLLLLGPILYFLMHGLRYWALGFILAGVLSDWLDGIIARKLNQCSDLGRSMDPVVDKINVLTVSLYMVLSPDYHFPLWYFVVLLSRETLLMLGGLLVIGKRRVVMESNRPGKNSAFANGLAVLCFIMDWQPWGWILIGIGLGFLFYSTLVYFSLFLDRIGKTSGSGAKG